MQGVELVKSHDIDHLFEAFCCVKVTRHIHVQSPPGKTGCIFDTDHGNTKLSTGLLCGLVGQKAHQALHAVEYPCRIGTGNGDKTLPGNFKRINLGSFPIN